MQPPEADAHSDAAAAETIAVTYPPTEGASYTYAETETLTDPAVVKATDLESHTFAVAFRETVRRRG